MSHQSTTKIKRTLYNRSDCQIGLVHLGFGAFHRAHQVVYIDDYMEQTGDLFWGVAAVNLRAEDAHTFAEFTKDQDGYLLKTTTPNGVSTFRMVRPHIHFSDWSQDHVEAEELLSRTSVKAVSMTVTESGYYRNEDWTLNTSDPVISEEITGGVKRSVYAYLSAALKRRMATTSAPVTILCCDNIRSNGEKLERNFKEYLFATNSEDLVDWIESNATFPNSMVDRITPRATDALRSEINAFAPQHQSTAIHGENFIQWVLQNKFASDLPTLSKVGVEIVEDVGPYEEAKIRILNGGHTALCYLGALAGHNTFDQAMTDPRLRAHFDGFEANNVLPGLTIELPFDKTTYRNLVSERFANTAIADDLGRVCMDGWSKFPIFIRPTVKSCLSQGISPIWCYESIASWYVFARRFANGQTHINYIEPYWDNLSPLLLQGQEEAFAHTEALWSNLPKEFNEFVPQLVAAIKRVEESWPT